MIYPTLYKRTSAGKIQTWYAETDGNKYRSVSGQLDGKKVTSEWTVCFGKNEGKKNGTTPETQAIADVEAMYRHRLDRDYHESPEDVDKPMRFRPMLAQKWKDKKKKFIGKRIFCQPKLDGIRCIATASGLWTREGKPILGAPHIYEDLAHLFEADSELILDGELYNHELRKDFNSISSAVRKQTPTDEELELSKRLIQYWTYDMPSHTGGFEARIESVRSLFSENKPASIVVVDTEEITFDQVDEKGSEAMDREFEGIMLRTDEPYENKRSNSLMKWKEFQDEEFEIDDILPGNGNRATIAARAVCKTKTGKKFHAGIIGDFDYCAKLLAEKTQVIGKLGTVVFQDYTPDGIPRFAKFKTVRFDV